ncbi:UNVERIFIED_CONTAM: hypothetical protein Slati_0943300 [Sesamum latifolium]|uniref:Uncharacterized protein n=1 Tax=Sesamum latifolium TaxID=2727402 RepID=A0AAW2XUP2_9LAMI
MIDLTNVRKWKDELVVDHINCGRALSLNCKDKLLEAFAIKMCIQKIKSRNFKELTIPTHDMELSIVNHFDNQRRTKRDSKRSERIVKPNVKESMAIKTIMSKSLPIMEIS